ncbi:MAG: hypothetical protein RLZZ450_7295 [Pseudomonadota bacterium]|jgi:hypothetical protein
MVRDEFLTFIKGSILALPQSLKAALRVAEDPDIADEGRALVAGAVIHWLSKTNTIPGVRGGALAYVDDVLVLLLALEHTKKLAPDAPERLLQHAPEVCETLDADLALARQYLGNGMSFIEQALTRVVKLKHMGRTAQQCVKDESAATMLYEELLAALVDFDPSPESVSRELKDLDSVIDELRKKAS